MCKSVKSKRPLLASGENSSKSKYKTLVAHKHKYIYLRDEERVEYKETAGEAFFHFFLIYIIIRLHRIL